MKILNLPIALLVIVIALGCKKDSTATNSYWIKFKKNGIEEKLTSYVSYCYNRPKAGDTSLTELILGGELKERNTAFYISILKNAKFTVGAYQTGDAGTTFIVDYMTNLGQLDELDYSLDNPPGYPTGYFRVNISSINGKEMRGSFTGNYLYEFFKKDTINITDGEFFIKTH
ncbi:MAG TPA: hypothetical protein PKA77_06130 [Chitinophagaceae bacterium]|jgi:hypothetical protein|nr:hypothetical protein [Chitinophagaceae bacterium]